MPHLLDHQYPPLLLPEVFIFKNTRGHYDMALPIKVGMSIVEVMEAKRRTQVGEDNMVVRTAEETIGRVVRGVLISYTKVSTERT